MPYQLLQVIAPVIRMFTLLVTAASFCAEIDTLVMKPLKLAVM
jgi:hypothetical protein